MTTSWAASVLLSVAIWIGTGVALPVAGLSPPGQVADSVSDRSAPRAVPVDRPAAGLGGGLGAAAPVPALGPGQRTAPAGVWLWPLAPPHPVLRRFDPPAQRWSSGHRGVDLAAPAGTFVAAPAEGVVTFAGVLVDRGVLVVSHPGGLRSTFEPVSALVEVGSVIHRGQPIATVDAVGAGVGHCAPVSCLHWGVIRGATYLDPLWLVSGRVVLLPLS